jgi:uncharacterized hydrophobic protein (TIGR00271 family)
MNQKNKKILSQNDPEKVSADLQRVEVVHPSWWRLWLERARSWISEARTVSQTRKAAVLDNLIESASPGVDYFILIILSCTIATLGLIVDSPAVVIGAMLVAPLLSPILGLSMAAISDLRKMFQRSLIAILVGMGVSLAISALLTFLAFHLPSKPLAVISNEILARTNPSLIDLGIALVGGVAAAYALAHPRLSSALPGVAIATSLMPPLCTVGIGIAFLDPSIFLGAALLFAANLAAIIFAGVITFALLGFGPDLSSNKVIISRSLRRSAILILVIIVLLAAFTWNSVAQARLVSVVRTAILETTSEVTQTRLVDLSISSEYGLKEISAILRTSRELTYDEVSMIQSIISDRIDSPVSLEIVTVPMQVIEINNP